VSGARRRDHVTPIQRSSHTLAYAAEDRFRDRNPCLEMYPWRRCCLSTATLRAGGKRPAIVLSYDLRRLWNSQPSALRLPPTEHVRSAVDHVSFQTMMTSSGAVVAVLRIWRRLQMLRLTHLLT